MTESGLSPVHALVLGGTDVGETSRLVHLFTAEHGRITVRARGVRRRGSRDAAVLEPFNVIEARVLHREGREVHVYGEGNVVQSNHAVRGSVERAAVAALWVEVLDHAHHCGADEAHDVLAWVRGSLAALAAAADPISLGLLGAWQLLGLIGHQPVLDRCVDTGREATEPLRFSFAEGGLVSRAPPGAEPGTVTRVSRGLVNALARAVGKSPEQIARQRLTGEQVEKTLDLVGKFCEYQLEIRLRSLRFLHSLRGH